RSTCRPTGWPGPCGVPPRPRTPWRSCSASPTPTWPPAWPAGVTRCSGPTTSAASRAAWASDPLAVRARPVRCLRSPTMTEPTWVPVGPADEVATPPWPCHDVGGTTLRLVRTPDGTIVAIAPACPHLDAPLDRAEVEGDQVLCPRHWYAW